MVLKGRVFKFGDNVNTDYIISGRYKFSITSMEELKGHIFEDIRPDFFKEIVPGESIIVAGRNFGCGSSREQAPAVIKEAGVVCVVAMSFARIFYRNGFNIGLALIEADTSSLVEADVLKIDLGKGKLINKANNITIDFRPLEGFMRLLLEEGGIVNLIKRHKSWPLIKK